MGDRKKRDADAAVIAGSTAVITPDDGIFYHNAPAVAYAGYGYGLPYGAYNGAYAGAYGYAGLNGYAGLHGLGYAGYPYLGLRSVDSSRHFLPYSFFKAFI